MSTRVTTADDIPWDLSPNPDPPLRDDRVDVVVDVALDAEAYRACLQQALHALHRVQRQHAALQRRHMRLIEEFRACRASVRAGMAA